MKGMDDRLAQEFAGALFGAIKDTVGLEAAQRVVDSGFLDKGIEVDASGILQFAPKVRYEHIQHLITSFVSQFTKDFGEPFAQRTVEALYRRMQKQSRNDRQVSEVIFKLTPRNFLVNEKVKQLSRDDLEKSQIELSQVNKKLEDLNAEFMETTKVLIRRDIELTQSNERLRDLDAIKSQFVSVAAHQLRTPLTGIKWTLHALLEQRVGGLNQEQQKFAQDAYKSVMRLISLVNDLLDAARLEEGRFGFKMQKQLLTPLVQEICASFEKSAQEKGIHFTLKVLQNDFPLLNLDKEKVGIVVENLVDNAIKYTAPGGSVTVILSTQGDRVTCDVVDTGIGMPKGQTTKIFSKFFRAENAQLYQTSGTGLGLFLAKNIVEHHGGIMSFTTEENKGTTFTFSLPVPKSK